MDEKRFNPCNTDACKEQCDNFGVRCEEICIDEVERLRARVAELECKLAKAKAKDIPMKYKRMEFNAQLQKENDELYQELAALKASQGEPVAWMHESPERVDVIHSKVKTLLQSAGQFHRSLDKSEKYTIPLYTSTPTIPEGYLLAEKACREFIRKVENGEARSVRSYAAMKMAIDLIDTIGWSTQKKWGE